jgi:hypothetical protein
MAEVHTVSNTMCPICTFQASHMKHARVFKQLHLSMLPSLPFLRSFQSVGLQPNLPPYEVRQAMKATADLRKRREEVRKQLLPAKKFAFASSATVDIVASSRTALPSSDAPESQAKPEVTPPPRPKRIWKQPPVAPGR